MSAIAGSVDLWSETNCCEGLTRTFNPPCGSGAACSFLVRSVNTHEQLESGCSSPSPAATQESPEPVCSKTTLWHNPKYSKWRWLGDLLEKHSKLDSRCEYWCTYSHLLQSDSQMFLPFPPAVIERHRSLAGLLGIFWPCLDFSSILRTF